MSLRRNADAASGGLPTRSRHAARISRGLGRAADSASINRPQERKLVMSKLFQYGGIVASIVLIAFGAGSIVTGYNGRDRVHSDLAREQIVGTPDSSIPNQLVNNGTKAEAFAKVMRKHTLEATGGQTYAQMRPLPGQERQADQRPEARRGQRQDRPARRQPAAQPVGDRDGADDRPALVLLRRERGDLRDRHGLRAHDHRWRLPRADPPRPARVRQGERRPSLRSRDARPCSRADRSRARPGATTKPPHCGGFGVAWFPAQVSGLGRMERRHSGEHWNCLDRQKGPPCDVHRCAIRRTPPKLARSPCRCTCSRSGGAPNRSGADRRHRQAQVEARTAAQLAERLAHRPPVRGLGGRRAAARRPAPPRSRAAAADAGQQGRAAVRRRAVGPPGAPGARRVRRRPARAGRSRCSISAELLAETLAVDGVRERVVDETLRELDLGPRLREELRGWLADLPVEQLARGPHRRRGPRRAAVPAQRPGRRRRPRRRWSSRRCPTTCSRATRRAGSTAA